MLNDETIVHNVSGYIAKDVHELIEFVNECSVDEYLTLRKSTWEFAEKYRHWSNKTLNDFNTLVNDAYVSGTHANQLESRLKLIQLTNIRHVEPCKGTKLMVDNNRFYIEKTDQKMHFNVNTSAALIWELCEEHNYLPKVIDILVDAYPDNKDSVIEEVIQVVSSLIGNEFLIEI